MADAGPKLLRGLLEVFILESLEQSPKHGYALLKEMTETFGQEPNRNRIYPLLGRLVRDGYVREVNESGSNRTLYALTDAGSEALRAYRRLPGAFRHALRRIWSVDLHPQHRAATASALRDAAQRGEDEDADEADDDGEGDGDDFFAEDESALPDDARPAAPAPAASAASSATPATAAAAAAVSPPERTTRIPVRSRDAPYPCQDARVSLEKDPASGDLTIRLTGCPMGAYEYCVKCPIHHAVRGMRSLVFPE